MNFLSYKALVSEIPKRKKKICIKKLDHRDENKLGRIGEVLPLTDHDNFCKRSMMRNMLLVTNNRNDVILKLFIFVKNKLSPPLAERVVNINKAPVRGPTIMPQNWTSPNVLIYSEAETKNIDK